MVKDVSVYRLARAFEADDAHRELRARKAALKETCEESKHLNERQSQGNEFKPKGRSEDLN